MKKTIGLLLLSSFLTTTASAAVLKNVTVNGTQRLEDSTIMSYLNVKKGQNITSSDLDKATKTLFATGLFSDVRIQMNNGTMSVQLEENPIVRDVFFEGNDKLDDDILKTEITLKPRSVYTKNKAQSDADRLLEAFRFCRGVFHCCAFRFCKVTNPFQKSGQADQVTAEQIQAEKSTQSDKPPAVKSIIQSQAHNPSRTAFPILHGILFPGFSLRDG